MAEGNLFVRVPVFFFFFSFNFNPRGTDACTWWTMERKSVYKSKSVEWRLQCQTTIITDPSAEQTAVQNRSVGFCLIPKERMLQQVYELFWRGLGINPRRLPWCPVFFLWCPLQSSNTILTFFSRKRCPYQREVTVPFPELSARPIFVFTEKSL